LNEQWNQNGRPQDGRESCPDYAHNKSRHGETGAAEQIV
jgi:hypothetical protein